MGQILELVGNVTKVKLCDKCAVPLFKHDPRETHSYFIGDNRIEVVISIIKGDCPRCGAYWESPDSRTQRNEAFREAIDNFWKKQLDSENISDTEMASVMYVVSRLMMKLGEEKKRLVAAELGRWLAGCCF